MRCTTSGCAPTRGRSATKATCWRYCGWRRDGAGVRRASVLVEVAARAHGGAHRQIILDPDPPVELDAGLAAQRPDDLGGDQADDRPAHDDEIAGFEPALVAHPQAVVTEGPAGAHFIT